MPIYTCTQCGQVFHFLCNYIDHKVGHVIPKPAEENSVRKAFEGYGGFPARKRNK